MRKHCEAIGKRIEKDQARKPRGNKSHPETKYYGGNFFFSKNVTNSKHIQKLFWASWYQPVTPMWSNCLLMTTDSYMRNWKPNTAHKLTANPGRFQIANVSLQCNTTGVIQSPSRKQRHDAYSAICWRNWWLNQWGKGNGCVRQRGSWDSGQGVCVEAHQGQPLVASFLTAVMEYISLMK